MDALLQVSSQADAAAAIAERDKAFATMRAKLALAGFEVHVVHGATGEAEFYVTRWGLGRTLDREGLDAFARQVGAA